jgi:hypothetical protein
MKIINSTNSDGIAAEAEGAGALSAKQELALQAVISHPTLKAAASAAGVSEATLWRYKQDPEFSRRLRDAQREAVDHAVLRLQRVSGDAVTVLHDLMMKEDAPVAARITAARTVIDYSLRSVEIEGLRKQIEELRDFFKSRQDEEARDAAFGEKGDDDEPRY